MNRQRSRSVHGSISHGVCALLLCTSACQERLDGPEPSVAGLNPALVCNVQLTTEVRISGSNLSPLAIDAATGDPRLAIPDVTLRRIEDLAGNAVTGESVTLPNDPDNPDAARVAWISNTEMTFEVYPELGLEPGLYEIQVTNRNGNQAVVNQAITAVPRPSLESVEPDLTCVEQGMRTVTLRGQAFVSADGTLPTVTIGGQMFTVDALEDCSPLPGPTTAEICTTAVVTIPQDALPTGDHAIELTNPEPAGCRSEEALDLFIASAPLIASVEPMAVCEINQPSEMIVTGEGFLRLADGAGGFIDPAITVDGASVAVTWDVASCAPVQSSVVTGEVCTSFSFPVPAGGYPVGSHDVIVSNPEPADCTAAAAFNVASAPVVTEVIPFAVCADGDMFSVLGTGFVDGAEILVNGTSVPTTYISDTELTGTIPDGFLLPGLYNVSVTNGTSCESNLLASALNVVAAPIVYFVDPPNVYTGIDMRITVWASGIYGNAPQVGIRATGSTDPLTFLNNASYDGQSRVQADLPAGLPPGDYDVVVVDDPCEAQLQNVLHLTDVTSVHISAIQPLFGVQGERTGISLRSDDPTPAGFENFLPTPRAYLNPVGGGVATEIQAVGYRTPNQVDGVVPDSLPPGEYEVVVVNPNGNVGILTTPTYRVLASNDPPPVITELVPGLVNDAPGQSVTVLGANFPTSATDVAVTADCRDPRMVGPDAPVTATVVGTPTATSIDTTWDMSGLSGYVCVVRVSNLLNNTFADFSAISVTNPSNNLNDFIVSLDMIEARRAAAGAAIRMNAQSRFLFAIGGDLGDDGVNPVIRHASVESVAIDPFGGLSGVWEEQRNSLPDSRSFINSTVVDRHVYIAGGRVGGEFGAVDNAVLRAFLLDPFEAPEISSLDLQQAEVGGLGAGIWYYRVAAVMKPWNAVDPAAPENNNPGGEALPSEPLVVQLPTGNLSLTLFWQGIEGADRYVIYRTPVADGISGEEVFLAEVQHAGAANDIQSFTDSGIDNTAETRTPMPLGSLGVWHQVGTLTTEREGAAIVAAPDPQNPALHYLYVLSGRDGAGNTVDTYEWAAITSAGQNIQTVAPFQVGANILPAGRWQHGAVYVDATRGPVGSDLWVYVLPGIDAAGSGVTDISALLVDHADGTGNDDGSLGAPVSVTNNNPTMAGYAYVAGNNFLHMIGGQTGAPAIGGRKSQITGSPDIGFWSNGTNLAVARYLMATARESAFVYLIGGQTDTELATRSTERTNF